MVRVAVVPMNSKATSSNDPSKLYCHTKVMLLPSRTEKGSGGVAVNVGANSTIEKSGQGQLKVLW